MRPLAISILFLLLFAQVWADEVKPPSDELNVTREEVNRWQEQADAGEAAAQYWLGKAYLYGWHLDSAPQRALALFRDSAEAEDLRGMNALGYCLQRGIGTEQDYEAALKWLEKASQAGSAEGANNLGNSYCLGWGVKVDETKALELYQKAAEAGSAKGMYNVAKCYHLGLGVEKNRELAFEWLEKAAAKDDVDALLFLGWEFAFGDRGGDQIDKGVDYYTRAADLGSSEAMISLGKIAARRDKEKTSAEWFRKAAEKGDPEGQFLYGGALLYGEGVDKDRAAAMEWLNKAASRGHLNAKELLESEERK
jgi:TPR repeat protein